MSIWTGLPKLMSFDVYIDMIYIGNSEMNLPNVPFFSVVFNSIDEWAVGRRSPFIVKITGGPRQSDTLAANLFYLWW